MKKKSVLIIAVIIAAVLLLPLPMQLNDGGTVEYWAILYKVSCVHSIKPTEPDTEIEFNEGIIVEILGFEVFNNVK